jgi:hypothetical protein
MDDPVRKKCPRCGAALISSEPHETIRQFAPAAISLARLIWDIISRLPS